MIKILIICLFIVSCEPEVNYKDLSETTTKSTLEKFELLNFKPKIDMMLLFLWPKDLGPENEKEVIEIISTSRKITKDKNRYYEIKYKLDTQYNQKNCDCHTIGICVGDLEMDDDLMTECEGIEDNRDINAKLFDAVLEDYELIKEKLKIIDAINIDVGADDIGSGDEDDPGLGSYDLKTKRLILNKVSYIGPVREVEFKVTPYKANIMKAKFMFNINQELFTGDIGISDQKFNVVFSGEIETSSGQRGLIYWEHSK